MTSHIDEEVSFAKQCLENCTSIENSSSSSALEVNAGAVFPIDVR